MMRKAEQFRREALRPKARLRKPRRTAAHALEPVEPGARETTKRRGGGHTASRNVSVHAARKASFALEDSATGRPSRKSSRGSSNRAKPDSNLKRRQTRATSSPKSRASRGK